MISLNISSIDLRKKMKKLLAVIICMINCISGIGQERKDEKTLLTDVGVDITSAIFKGAFSVTLGRELSRHWSLEGTSTFLFGMLIRKDNNDEVVHYGEIGRQTDKTTNVGRLVCGGIKLKYWFNDIYKGTYMITGIRNGAIADMDAVIGCGYMINILKGFNCSVSYEIDIRSSILQDRMTGNGISLTFSYTY